MNEYIKANRELWEGWTELHRDSEFYDLEGFKRGKSPLYQFELDELGPLNGKSFLHLQCHFGLDTLSFARLGAEVTGLDISPKAVDLAKSIAKDIGIDARFVCSNIYDALDHISDQYDIVYTSGGVLTWLPDLASWAKIAAALTKPGGKLFVRENHPLSFILDDDTPTIRYPYFMGKKPLRFEEAGSYADPDDKTVRVSYEWPHPMSEIINSIFDAGLSIERFKEYNFSTYEAHNYLKQHEDGMWYFEDVEESIPLMFMIKANKL